MSLTFERAMEVLSYDALSGAFTWKKRTGKKQNVGKRAGFVCGNDSYRRLYIGIDGTKHQAHRIAWLMSYGSWPQSSVDHINGDATDNRIGNLRLCTASQNQANRKARADSISGFKGVSWHAQTGKWRASVIKDGKRHSFGLYHTREQASAAYYEKASQLFGEFARAQ